MTNQKHVNLTEFMIFNEDTEQFFKVNLPEYDFILETFIVDDHIDMDGDIFVDNDFYEDIKSRVNK